MFEKAIVIGSPGSGKSTFSRKLNEITGLPLYHLDLIWHKSDKTNITREEFDRQLNSIFLTDKWIIDGNYRRTIEPRLKACDTVFLFDLPIDVCLAGAAERVGKKRPDMPWCENELSEEFRQFILDFPEQELPRIYSLLDRYKDKNIVIFKSREQSEQYLLELNKFKE